MPPLSNTCKIPVSARMEIVNGKAVMTDAEYKTIPASIIARFLLEKFGFDINEDDPETANKGYTGIGGVDMEECLFSKERAWREILVVLRRNDADFAAKLLIRAINLESVMREKERAENRG